MKIPLATTPAMRYNPTKAMPATVKKPKGIIVPEVVNPDTGIHVVRSLAGTEPRRKLWYYVDGKKRYVCLPSGTTLEEARTRRDTLYKNLRTLYGAKKRKPQTDHVRKPHVTRLTPEKFIYRRKPLVVRILGKQIGEAETWAQAQHLRDTWLKANPAAVPQLTEAIKKIRP